MVKFQVRWMKKRYKGKDYTSKKYQMEFPVRANLKIEPHKTRNFEYLDITSMDTPKLEFLNIQLVRNKTLRKTTSRRQQLSLFPK